MLNILIFGTLPPPIGGVSIHLERFLNFLKGYKNEIKVDVCDIKKKTFKGIFLVFFKADIVHIHISNNFKIVIALISRLFGKKVIYTHHNSRVGSQLCFKLINFLSNNIILVNDKEINLEKLNMNKIRHIPAFLPPYSFRELPKYINKKIDNSDFIISTNCFQYTLIDGKDLYGFDILIEAYSKLIYEKKLKKSLLLLVDPSDTTKEYIDSILLNHSHLDSSNLLYVAEPIDFSTLIKKSNVTIRATRSDGDSLSVRESLYLNTPIIASDVTYRPDDTILFEHENVDELRKMILKVYEDKDSFFIQESENFANSIISLYKSI